MPRDGASVTLTLHCNDSTIAKLFEGCSMRKLNENAVLSPTEVAVNTVGGVVTFTGLPGVDAHTHARLQPSRQFANQRDQPPPPPVVLEFLKTLSIDSTKKFLFF